MAETVDTAAKQPATSAATAYKLAPIFLEKEKPVRPPYEPPDQSWIDEWESDDEDEEVEKKDTTDRISGLPVEIIMMIASHLTPGSLLAFSRVSRFFRSLVFTQRAESIWADVRRREGWQDSEAGGLTEVQLANLLDGDDCTVCQNYAYPFSDFRLRVRLCYPCIANLRRKGESISAEYWHLHPRAFECCLSTRKTWPDMTSELARGEDSIFFVPDVLKQSAELHRLEAEAIAQNQSPQPVSEAYVVSRAQYRHRAKHDARVWENHRRWLQDQADSKLALRKSLRRADISKRLLPLGFVDADFDTLHLDGRWCSSCLYQNYDDDLAEWEYYEEELNLDTHDEEPQTRDQAMSTTTSDAQGAQVRVEGAVTRDPSLEQKLGDFREQAREEKMAAMLADLHTDCMPGPASLYQFFQSDERLTDEEWEKYKAPIVAIPISFATFLALPTVETLWYPANAFIDARGWPPLEPQILSEIRTRIRLDKVILFDRLARAHVANTGVLLHTDTKAIASSSSTFVDCDPSKGLAPLHAALTDRDMDPLFAQVTSLFRCGICSTKLPYPDIAIHLVDDHYVPNVTAYAHVPSSDFRKAIKSLLDDLGHSSQLELAAFEVFYADCHFDVTTRSASGELETSVGETWAQVLSGKSPAELDAGLLKLSHSTDRNIVEIKLSTVSMSDEDA